MGNVYRPCEICGALLVKNGTRCEKCELTIFQIDTIIDEYLKTKDPPPWLIDGMAEISSWAYNGHPRGAAYFNTANEIVEIFAIDRREEIPIDEIHEINYTNLPENQILKILQDAFIIEYDTDFIYPGSLSKKLMEVRWEGYEMDSPEVKKKIKEMHGIISVSITKSLLLRDHFKPQKALALFKLVSQIILDADATDKVAQSISEYDLGMAFIKLPQRQQNKIQRDMCGFCDGETKIIKDKDMEGDMPLKDYIIIYSENMRERYRSRDREERSYT